MFGEHLSQNEARTRMGILSVLAQEDTMFTTDIVIWLSVGLTLALAIAVAIVAVRTLKPRSPHEQTTNATLTKIATLQQALFHIIHG